MNRTECTLMDAAKKIEKEFLLIDLPITLEKFLTSEEYETLKFASKGILQDNCEENWDKLNRIYQKVDKLAVEAPVINLRVTSELIRKESLNSKPKFIGFETNIFDLLLKKVNDFISSDECEEFINFDFKVTEHNRHFVYSGFVKYRAPAQNEDKTKHVSNDVKEFASEVRKTIEDTLENFRESEHCSFADSKLALITLIEAVQNKLDEILK